MDQFGHGLHQGLGNNQGYQNPPLGRQGALARARSAPWRERILEISLGFAHCTVVILKGMIFEMIRGDLKVPFREWRDKLVGHIYDVKI